MTEPPKQLGPYTIDREIGRGGMGVVYLARDTRLDRPVAIKSLPEHLAQDPDRLGRFEREARTLASLTHPNVAGIYGVEEHEGARYLVLEFVEGETLAERLDRGPLPLDETLELAAQIAAGVEAAHDAGVVHRDLKPANIKITPDGQAKVLDFGLAKSGDTTNSSASSTNIPTVTSPAILTSPTIPGAIMGTAPYMSPEQARGRSVDKRSDIWSFGVILYEMLTNASPFHGETVSDSIGAILHKDPDRALLPPDTPRTVHRVLDRCLERDKNKRLRDIGDARLEIERAAHESPSVDSDAPRQGKGASPLLLIVVALLFAAIGAGAILLTTPKPTPPLAVQASILPPDDVDIVFVGDLAGPAVISRDGARLAFVAKKPGELQQLYIRSIGANDPTPVPGADGAIFPFWSWDGRSIGYFANGELRSYDTQTRANRKICDAPGGRGGAWLADGTIVFTPSFQSPIHSVSSQGGESTPVTTLNKPRHTSHRWPRPTPDGNNFIYIAVSHGQDMIDESALYLATPPNEPDIEITRARYSAEVVGDQLLVVRNKVLTATSFNTSTGELTGDPVPILTGVANDLSTWNAAFSSSASGALVYHESDTNIADDRSAGSASSLGEARRTELIARDGRVVFIVADDTPQNTVSFSPDGETIAISAKPEGTSDLDSFDVWLYRAPLGGTALTANASEDPYQEDPLESSARSMSRLSEPPRRLTFLDGPVLRPQWSPDGQWLAFGNLGTVRNGSPNTLSKISANGGSAITLIETPNGYDNGIWPNDWTDDGRHLVYCSGSWVNNNTNDLYVLNTETLESTLLIGSHGDQFNAQVSPDGKWLLYTSNETGTYEIFVVPFQPGWDTEREQGNPTPPESAKWRVSIAGGGAARWNPMGGELCYISASNSMIAVPVRTEGVDFIHGSGSALFQTYYDISVDFDMTRNGRGFAINASSADTAGTLSILTNWQSLLNQ